MFTHGLKFACTSFFGILGACTSVDYVPDIGWSDNEWSADFYERWFGNQLIAAGEPSFATRSHLGEIKSRFRLLVLPSFSPASIFRVDEAKSGKITIFVTVLDGAGGYDPGKIERQWQRELTKIEATALASAISDAELPLLQLDAEPLAELDDDGNEFITVCADGTQIVVEKLTSSGRSFVTRHECELDRYPNIQKLYTLVSEFRPFS